MSVLPVVGCSSGPGGGTTCEQYAQMGPDTGLLANLTDEQANVIKSMLEQHDRVHDSSTVSMAALQIVAYCNLYGGKAGSTAAQPIENIPGLS